MGKELIVEIGTEEIPAGMLKRAIGDLREIAAALIRGEGLSWESIETYGTPRRIALRVAGLPQRQPDRTREVVGPPTRIAFDEEGRHTKAALGFAKSQGVEPRELVVIENARGEFVGIRKEIRGAPIVDILSALLPNIIRSIPFQKSMRWGRTELAFARPIRWLLAALDGEPLNFSIEDVDSGSLSYGHRFLAPEPFPVSSWSDYLCGLRERYVVVDPAERREYIAREVERIAGELGGCAEKDEELLDVVTNQVEYPVVLCGGFEEEFLALPKEVLTSVMKSHQRYFPVYADGGEEGAQGERLLPKFIFVSGTKVPDPGVVVRGNERVIRARFNDAKFFFEEDLKTPLRERREALREMVFLSGAGNYYEKTLRLRELAAFIGKALGMGREKIADLGRAGELSKADLATQMVFEFPELEGTMGKYYALQSGEKEEVALALEEHYMPRSREDSLPRTELGTVLSLADKIDNISACFTAGLQPTGTSDPYALRRQAIAALNIILARDLPLSLAGLAAKGVELIQNQREKKGQQPASAEEVSAQVLDFLAERFKNIMIAEDYPQEVIDAVTSAEFDQAPEARKKIQALAQFTTGADFESLAIAFRRVVNIVGGQPRAELRGELLTEEAEERLYESFLAVKGDISQSSRKGDYSRSLELMKSLKEPVDIFFDKVLVMDENERLRLNRLALLWEIRDLFFTVADFSKITA